MFGGAAEAVAAATTLTAAIPAAPMAVLTVVVAIFTMGSLGSFIFLAGYLVLRPDRKSRIAQRRQFQT
jgi:hypothetical protein